ncbi:MAG: putative addiction module antidote protein [Treponema sp.]|jgi:probable addiction module antidote protein|nr:putative addiction module antidote protein [Treponema sp.]
MIKTKKFDVINYLKTDDDIHEYLEVVLEEKDYNYLPVALADIARARKAMTPAAKAAGVTRTSLYQSLSKNGKPAFDTVAKVALSLGYKITLVPMAQSG